MPKKKTVKAAPEIKTVGLVGLGLMGRGIATCLLTSGLEVVAYNRNATRRRAAGEQIAAHVDEVVKRKVRKRSDVRRWEKRLTLTGRIADLAGCDFVIETVAEDLKLKRDLYDQIEAAVGAKTVIASNTSAIPVGILQKGRKRPGRFIVVHWAEPAWITPFLEIIPGKATTPRTKKMAVALGEVAGKQPSLANFDIRGFIANRLMYAMMREACHLVEAGVADVETVDRSLRNDMGCWAPIAGPFRWMDLTNPSLYAIVMKDVFPDLCNRKALPEMMRKILKTDARGVYNGRGHYKYTKAQSRKWIEAWTDFTYDLQDLLARYDRKVGGL